MWNVKNKSGTSNNRDSWNNIKITQKISEQHTGKKRHQGATEKSLSGHCALGTAGSADVKVYNIQRGKLHCMFLLWLDSPQWA